MARASRGVVQIERLSDQVYQLIRDDLRSGEFGPAQRLLEVELADRYRVSRTPVREALFQLSREGLLSGSERGYSTPVYSREDILHRLEVKRLLDPQVAEHVAASASPAHLKAMTKHLAQERAAHQAGRVQAFIRANQDMRQIYLSACDNDLLVRCVRLIDDQFEATRSQIHTSPANRERTIEHETRLLDAITTRDSKRAAAQTDLFLDFLEVYAKEEALEPV